MYSHHEAGYKKTNVGINVKEIYKTTSSKARETFVFIYFDFKQSKHQVNK
jgi:hypothetical protein